MKHLASTVLLTLLAHASGQTCVVDPTTNVLRPSCGGDVDGGTLDGFCDGNEGCGTLACDCRAGRRFCRGDNPCDELKRSAVDDGEFISFA